MMPRIFCAVFLMLALSQYSFAVVVVPGTANGNFGADEGRFFTPDGTPLVQGTFLNSGDEVQITATGQVTDGTPTLFGPDGTTTLLAVNGTTLSAYFPLEEQFVDAGTLTLPRPVGTTVDNTLGLFGAFLDQAVVEAAGFSATDSDFGGSVLSSDLFLVGSLLNFTAPSNGYLFFGVNDWYGINNAGAFNVTLQEVIDQEDNGVPIPVPLTLLGIGLVVLNCQRNIKTIQH